jgi:hypothetical protein
MSGDRERDGEQPDAGDPSGQGASAAPTAEPARPELDLETAFADIVARYGDPAPATGPWPSAEDLDPDADTVADRDPVTLSLGPATATTWHDPPELAALDEHFVPPEVPPIRGGDLVSRLAWASVVGGPLVLLLAAMIGGGLPSYLLAGALLAFVGGFVALVARMPSHPPTDDGQNGAVL